MGRDSLLTSTYREWLEGEKEVGSNYVSKLKRTRIPERVAQGLRDLAILNENRDKIDMTRILMKYTADQTSVGPDDRREGWRGENAQETMTGALSFLMTLASSFNYGSADWERWIKTAYEQLNPGGFAHVTIEWSPNVRPSRVMDYYDGESLALAEVRALYHLGLIPREDLPQNFPQPAQSSYERPELVRGTTQLPPELLENDG